MHAEPVGQTVPQLPQLVLLVSRSTHPSSHAVCPSVEQTQIPSVQGASAGQMLPQVPQFWFEIGMHCSAHSKEPSGQPSAGLPPPVPPSVDVLPAVELPPPAELELAPPLVDDPPPEFEELELESLPPEPDPVPSSSENSAVFAQLTMAALKAKPTSRLTPTVEILKGRCEDMSGNIQHRARWCP